ncbi:peptidoglycan-binding protein [Streptomyces sp. NPDC020965]|uniref:peptidoglycan-binding protein n=1 Tax=Streptomyces sp. NPDC020965 TaxID=3365105 RepID=UPI0037A88776
MGETTLERLPDGAPGDEGGAAGPPRPARHRRRRGRRTAVAIAVLAAGGAVAAATLGLVGEKGSSDGTAGSELPPNTTEVTKETLKDVHRADGELGHGPATTAQGRLGGTVTDLPGTGDRVTRGKPLYEVDNGPVTLMYGALPAYRPLKKGVEGADVKQLEQNLDALGYGGFTVDEEFTAATADAVREWQEDLGLRETGTVELGRVVFASGPVRVEGLEAAVGDPIGPGGRVLSYTGTAKAVTVELDAADQRLAKKGAAVTVTLPDDSVVAGRIVEVSTVIEPASGQEEAETKIEVVVTLSDAKGRKAADAYTLAAVGVGFVADTRTNVLTVPVAALVALAEGGFGVEVVKGSTSSYVPVTTGLFADGRVEISGTGITGGTTVGIPK